MCASYVTIHAIWSIKCNPSSSFIYLTIYSHNNECFSHLIKLHTVALVRKKQDLTNLHGNLSFGWYLLVMARTQRENVEIRTFNGSFSSKRTEFAKKRVYFIIIIHPMEQQQQVFSVFTAPILIYTHNVLPFLVKSSKQPSRLLA